MAISWTTLGCCKSEKLCPHSNNTWCTGIYKIHMCKCRTNVPMVCKNRKLAYIVNDALNSWVNNDKTSSLTKLCGGRKWFPTHHNYWNAKSCSVIVNGANNGKHCNVALVSEMQDTPPCPHSAILPFGCNSRILCGGELKYEPKK